MSNIPILRFKEFSGEWKEKKFEDIFNFSTGKNIKQNEASPEFEIPCVRYGELYHMYGEVISKVINKTNLDKTELKFSIGDEILLPSAGEDPLDIGSASALVVPNVAIGRTINILRPIEKNVYSPRYIAYYINQMLKTKISKLAKGVSISNVYNSDLKKLNILLPNIVEQEKIVSFLSSVDIKIEQLTKKEELLQQYKKGVMQKIFSQEIRFKADDRSDFPEWEEKKLGDIGEFKSGSGFPENEQGGTNGTPFYKVSDMNLPNNAVQMIESNNYVTEEQIKKMKLKPIKKSSIIFAKVGAAIFLERKRIAQNFILDNNMMAFIPKENIDFLYQWINRVHLSKFAQVGALPSYNASDLKTIKISLPSQKEQEKIASSLYLIDTKIEQVQNQLMQTKEFKKALLQQMFI